ncbi:uncharacterized protein MELLADRAFT_102525 [Melampsora larici-populina 98AG31]|uniref:Prefoldin subunit 1 n=1 Tax=Melampsora larici-populina (strain 98AG31 / pathotype 3-4-7) TaxID=747676 RepID=F4R721_MELLP|nr:uncharacterized protein MELLADRAFT_102525 [Melampsora larici-populina 98AG31]EGG11501.1 hypothetical protein MELLADRAFT_102525 [Melampsora larici-populina 98AG31]
MSNQQKNDEIHKILTQLQIRSKDTGRLLNKSKSENLSSSKDLKQIKLTLHELNRLSESSNPSGFQLYKPVGKMFMLKPEKVIKDELIQKEKIVQENQSRLETKIKSLESEVETNQRALREIMRSIDHESS